MTNTAAANPNTIWNQQDRKARKVRKYADLMDAAMKQSSNHRKLADLAESLGETYEAERHHCCADEMENEVDVLMGEAIASGIDPEDFDV